MARTFVGLTVLFMLAGCASGASTARPSTTFTPASATPAVVATPLATATPAAVAKVTSVSGTGTCGWMHVYAPGSGAEDVTAVNYCTVTTNDPRASGTETADPWQGRQWGTSAREGAGVEWGRVRLENAGGTWEGTGSGVYSSDRGDIVVSWYKGTGGYAGLGYFEMRAGKAPFAILGQIFPGDPPNLAGLPPVTGEVPSPNVPAIPTPIPGPTPRAIAYGPVAVVQGSSGFTVVDIGAGVYAGIDMVNDPRVSGTFLSPSWNMNSWGATGDSQAGAEWGASRLENAGGAWQGVASGIYENGGDLIAVWYKGTGGYAGLAYFELIGRPDLFDPNQVVDHMAVFGQVFPGDPP